VAALLSPKRSELVAAEEAIVFQLVSEPGTAPVLWAGLRVKYGEAAVVWPKSSNKELA
jgi:hypothetical protein